MSKLYLPAFLRVLSPISDIVSTCITISVVLTIFFKLNKQPILRLFFLFSKTKITNNAVDAMAMLLFQAVERAEGNNSFCKLVAYTTDEHHCRYGVQVRQISSCSR